MIKKPRLLLVMLLMLAFFACSTDSRKADVSDIKIDFKFNRFEKDLFAGSDPFSQEKLNSLRQQYGSFTDVFIHNVLSIAPAPDSVIVFNLQQFIYDTEVKDIYRLTDSVFHDTGAIEAGLKDFLKHYHYYYPEKPVPGIATYISAFNYAVITTDSTIGIGLDMFLGSHINYYPRLGIPLYIFTKFSPEYIVPSAIKAWFQSDNEQSQVKNELLSQLVYQGKLLYYINAMAPELNDTLKTGYSQSQLKWCVENEASIWSFFIENKLLFNTDPSQFSKFVNEGPATNGFPKEAPGRIGAYVGWQIVNAYMKKNKEASLDDLLKENDAQKILEVSGYKPQK